MQRHAQMMRLPRVIGVEKGQKLRVPARMPDAGVTGRSGPRVALPQHLEMAWIAFQQIRELGQGFHRRSIVHDHDAGQRHVLLGEGANHGPTEDAGTFLIERNDDRYRWCHRHAFR
jgi:hypothetical protein